MSNDQDRRGRAGRRDRARARAPTGAGERGRARRGRLAAVHRARARTPAGHAARHGRHRLGPLVLAAAHLDAGRADPALPAVARRHPRLADPADQRRRSSRCRPSRTRTPRSRRSTTSSGCSTSTARCGSPRSTSCCSSPSSAASCRAPGSSSASCAAGRRAPRKRLTRLPAYTTWRTDAEPERGPRGAPASCCAGGASARTRAGDAVAAEKGYLREAGNLIFHVALIVMLVAFAVGQLWKSEGGKLIVEGDGFSNTLTQYDDFKSGIALRHRRPRRRSASPSTSSIGTYERTGPQKGTPRTYRAARHLLRGRGRQAEQKTVDRGQRAAGDRRLQGLPDRRTATRPSSPSRTAGARSSTRAPSPFLPHRLQRSPRPASIKVHGRLPRQERQAGPARLPGRSSCRRSRGDGTRARCSRSSPRCDFPVLVLNAYHGTSASTPGCRRTCTSSTPRR